MRQIYNFLKQFFIKQSSTDIFLASIIILLAMVIEPIRILDINNDDNVFGTFIFFISILIFAVSIKLIFGKVEPSKGSLKMLYLLGSFLIVYVSVIYIKEIVQFKKILIIKYFLIFYIAVILFRAVFLFASFYSKEIFNCIPQAIFHKERLSTLFFIFIMLFLFFDFNYKKNVSLAGGQAYFTTLFIFDLYYIFKNNLKFLNRQAK